MRHACAIAAAIALLLAATPAAGRRRHHAPMSRPLKDTPAKIHEAVPKARDLDFSPDTVSLLIFGDIMMHSRQLEYDHASFLAHIAPAMREADLCAVNMEFSLGGEPYSGYPAFSAPDSYARYIAADCGADILLLANNHILDCGPSGLMRTLEVYGKLADSLGTSYTGAALDPEDRARRNPLIVSRKGIRIAIVNMTYGTNMGGSSLSPSVSYLREATVKAHMEAARQSGADFIVALPHWGTEYELRHSPWQEKWAHLLAEEGADAIVGAHPHVVQDSTHMGGVPVIYSLGNTVSNMSAANTQLGLAARLRFVNDRCGSGMAMLEPQLEFLWCSRPGGLSGNYSVIFTDEWEGRREEWLNASDYDKMISTLKAVKAATGIR